MIVRLSPSIEASDGIPRVVAGHQLTLVRSTD